MIGGYRRESDSSNGGENSASLIGPAGISMDSLKSWPRASKVVSGPCRLRASAITAATAAASSTNQVASPAGQAARGPEIVTRMLSAGEPDSATMPPPARLSDASNSRLRTTRAACGGKTRVALQSLKIQPHPSAGKQAIRKAAQPGNVEIVAIPAPGSSQQLQALSELNRCVFGERQRLAVRLFVTGDLEHTDQRAQRAAQIMAEAGAEQFCEP